MQKLQRWLQPSGNLQVSIMARRQLDALRRDQVQVRVVVLAGRRHAVHRAHHFLVLLRSVTASTLGCTCRMTDSSTPMQPVTMTLPFSAMASPIASSDSALALSMKPQVLTTTTSASLYSGVTS